MILYGIITKANGPEFDPVVMRQTRIERRVDRIEKQVDKLIGLMEKWNSQMINVKDIAP